MNKDRCNEEGGVRSSQITEQFSIPGAGGIIVKRIDNTEHILLQERCEPDAPNEHILPKI